MTETPILELAPAHRPAGLDKLHVCVQVSIARLCGLRTLCSLQKRRCPAPCFAPMHIQHCTTSPKRHDCQLAAAKRDASLERDAALARLRGELGSGSEALQAMLAEARAGAAKAAEEAQEQRRQLERFVESPGCNLGRVAGRTVAVRARCVRLHVLASTATNQVGSADYCICAGLPSGDSTTPQCNGGAAPAAGGRGPRPVHGTSGGPAGVLRLRSQGAGGP